METKICVSGTFGILHEFCLTNAYSTVRTDIFTDTVVFLQVKEQDRGTYDCVVVNKMGKATCSAKLSVQGQVQPPVRPVAPMAGAQAPQLIEPMRDQFVDEGSPTTFKCKIVANPPPVIQVGLQTTLFWLKGTEMNMITVS